jgi:hypothetical protein
MVARVWVIILNSSYGGLTNCFFEGLKDPMSFGDICALYPCQGLGFMYE